MIRRAVAADSSAILALAHELGYPATNDEMQRRLERLLPSEMHAVFVAEHDGNVVGWIHVATLETLESDLQAEIRGLVVAGTHRGSGIGAQLVARAESWAREAGFRRIRVRSNVARERTQRFYLRLGYIIRKTQNAFDKQLGGSA